MELLFFDVRSDRTGLVTISWATSMEMFCKGFEVVREKDGKTEVIAWEDGSMSSTVRRDYKVEDRGVLPNEYYIYSLVQYDHNMPGKVIATKAVHTTRYPLLISDLYPNPAQSEIFMSIDSLATNRIEFHVFNNLGQSVYTDSVDARPGLTRWRLTCNNYPEGFYSVRVTWKGGESVKHFFKMN